MFIMLLQHLSINVMGVPPRQPRTIRLLYYNEGGHSS